jgi:hypothetical protein
VEDAVETATEPAAIVQPGALGSLILVAETFPQAKSCLKLQIAVQS